MFNNKKKVATRGTLHRISIEPTFKVKASVLNLQKYSRIWFERCGKVLLSTHITYKNNEKKNGETYQVWPSSTIFAEIKMVQEIHWRPLYIECVLRTSIYGI